MSKEMTLQEINEHYSMQKAELITNQDYSVKEKIKLQDERFDDYCKQIKSFLDKKYKKTEVKVQK